MELNEEDLQFAKETIQKTGLFAVCGEAELNQLYGGLEKQGYKQNSTVLFQGEISSKLCLVESGTVSVNVRKGKDKVKVAELGANSFFGEISLLTPRAATATIKAETDAAIIFLPGEVVQRLARANPALQEALNQKISERLASQKQQTDK